MDDEYDFNSKVEALKTTVKELDEVVDRKTIEETAKRLEGVNFAPPVVLPISEFLRSDKKTLLAEIDKLLAMPDEKACALAPDSPGKCRELRLQFIATLIFHYKKLSRLRAGDAEEWDEIDELYIHD
ncbi:hypothetical protein [Desulfopila sp. IMCC35008]|uniref:hypothetical protein n=1 Tax=Desulfopila sp. IMCC35008 TaxID=2653858 RepID=UPI0013D6786B|nr:hypothetical protein [Desulfopila sp. IMCC35008]